MPNYSNYDEMPQGRNDRNFQRDLVLASNEFCFLQSKTNGIIKTYTGPITMTISAQESLMVFDIKTKQFKETNDFDFAKSLFVSAPEGWYITLKNPAKDNIHPEIGKAVVSPDIEIGKKINIAGPCSFSLFPGQMARTIQGHRLRSNQYLLARVYDPAALSQAKGVALDKDGNEVEVSNEYFAGQLLVIKGTEVSFYIPPTGIEVLAIDNDPANGYIRDAVTLERLEYCILKNENGTKSYNHGPAVVFPGPTETFVTAPSGGYIFRAIELSPISGVYVKVIAEYTEGEGKNKVTHPVGEELFITGKDQMIYYPRPEHAVISYDNKTMHHAIAIPEGEGRYVMNRLTGEIKTVRGPAMYLPDPRTEVVVKRKLTTKQCRLWYPGNDEAIAYNNSLTEKSVEKSLKAATDSINSVYNYCTTTAASNTLANWETNASISRGTSYTKPRTITLDNKYDGVVSINIWTGYAVNVISKNGNRKVVCGPQTILLDYDQTLEVLRLSSGTPKTEDYPIKTVYLKYENNKVSDVIPIETKDFVTARIKVSYCVDFDKDYMDKWFNIEDYVKYLCDRQRTLIKKECKKYTIEELYQNYSDIIHDVAINKTSSSENADRGPDRRFFHENGMFVYDCDVLYLDVDDQVRELFEDEQYEMVKRTITLANASRKEEIAKQLDEIDRQHRQMENETAIYLAKLKKELEETKLNSKAEVARLEEQEAAARQQAELDLQDTLNQIQKAKLERQKALDAAKQEAEIAKAQLETARQTAYTESVEKIMQAISPDLVSAITTASESETLRSVSESLAPYALAQGRPISTVVNDLVRGTTLEETLAKVHKLSQ